MDISTSAASGAEEPTIEAMLNGLFPPGFAAAERVNLSRWWERGGPPPPPRPPTRIGDARPLQAAAASEADFLEDHGFVLLDAPTRVRDWDDQAENARYCEEVEALVRTRVYPGRNVHIVQPPRVLRRGAGTDNPAYGAGVHADFGTNAEDYQHNVAAFASAEAAAGWRSAFDRDEVEGFVVLDFWRTTNMEGPLRHMPLALCDATSIDPADLVATALEGVAPGGAVTHHLGLRGNPGQAWYHYPGMTADETLVFKLFELRRGDPRFRACFHSAFVDPSAPASAPPRQSCEHRVSVVLLADESSR